MVTLIQNTQNRDSAAIQLKLNEIIRSGQGAHNAMLGLETLDTSDLERRPSVSIGRRVAFEPSPAAAGGLLSPSIAD